MTPWTVPAPGGREVAPGLVISDTWSRLAAYGIDALLLFVVNVAIRFVAGPSTSVAGAAVASPNDIVWTVASLAVDGLYFISAWSGGRRATIGQRLLRIQVGRAFDGASLTLAQAARRWLGFGVWLSLFSLITVAASASALAVGIWTLALLLTTARSPTKQGVHDLLARSLVVRAADAPSGTVQLLMVVVLWVAVQWFGGYIQGPP